MGTRLLLVCVIYQTITTESLGGVTLPFADVIGIVTPVKPKPFSPSTVSSSGISSSSQVCDSKDIIPKLFLPVPGTREFSCPLALTSSSRALPVPKIDSLSIADVKLPEKLREKFLHSKLCKAPIRNAKLDIGTPDVSLPCKYPFLSSSTNPQNVSPTYSSWDMYSSSLNKLSLLSNIKTLPIVPVKPLKSSNTDVLCSASKINNVLAQTSITPLSRSRTLDSPLTLEARKPTFSEQLNSNTFSPFTSCSSPYPLYYKSMYLPGVRTPSETFSPNSYNAVGNIDFSRQSGSCNLLSPNTLTSDSILNLLAGRNDPYLSICSNPIKAAEIPKPINTIQLPKIPSNVPLSIKPVFSAQNAAAENLWSPSEANYGSASIAFESKIIEPSEFLLSPVLKDSTDPKMLRSSMPYLLANKIPDFKLKHCTPLNTKSSASGSSNFLNSKGTSLVPISTASRIVDMLSNKLSSFDSSNSMNTPDMISIISACLETLKKNYTNCHSCNCQTCADSKNVPSLEQIHLSNPFAPKISSHQHSLFTEECVTNALKYPPPIIPLQPIPTISLGSSEFSPTIYFPSKISQTPSVSYVNQSPISSVAQSTSNTVLSVNNLVSNTAQNILSSYKSYIDFASPNVPIIPTYTIQSNPYDNPELKLKQTLPVLPLPQDNLVKNEPILPTISLPIFINPPAIETYTIVSSDGPCKSSEFEFSSCKPLFISPPQPTATVLPPTSLITFSSPQVCPSYLASPSLPSYPTIASPFYMEAPVYRVSSSENDSEVEKLIELMLLAEILQNDESFDWDDLDTLLAYLYVS